MIFILSVFLFSPSGGSGVAADGWSPEEAAAAEGIWAQPEPRWPFLAVTAAPAARPGCSRGLKPLQEGSQHEGRERGWNKPAGTAAPSGDGDRDGGGVWRAPGSRIVHGVTLSCATHGKREPTLLRGVLWLPGSPDWYFSLDVLAFFQSGRFP